MIFARLPTLIGLGTLSDKISSKANKTQGILRRTLVISNFALLCGHHTFRNITKLEQIQCRANKFILKTDVDYERRRDKLRTKEIDKFEYSHYLFAG